MPFTCTQDGLIVALESSGGACVQVLSYTYPAIVCFTLELHWQRTPRITDGHRPGGRALTRADLTYSQPSRLQTCSRRVRAAFVRPKGGNNETASDSLTQMLSLLGLSHEESNDVYHRALEASPVAIGAAQVALISILLHSPQQIRKSSTALFSPKR